MSGGKETENSKEGEEIRYYYSRERRLANASDGVRWTESLRSGKKPGIFGYLFATRSSRFLFLTVLVFALFSLVFPVLENRAGKTASLGGGAFTAKALYYEGRVLLVLARSGAPGGKEDILAVSISGQGLREERLEFPWGERETQDYRLAVEARDGKPKELRLTLRRASEKAEIRVPVD